MGHSAFGMIFHHVGPEFWATSAEAFERILDKYKDRLVTPLGFMQAAIADALTDEVVITLDDGLRSQWEIAKPILDRRGLGAFWFVSTGPLFGHPLQYEVDHWLWRTHAPEFEADNGPRRRQIRDDHPDIYNLIMAPLRAAFIHETDEALCQRLWIRDDELDTLLSPHAIGSHTDTHPMQIDHLSEPLQLTEYAGSQAYLSGFPAWLPVLAHPGGRYGPNMPKMLHELGYQIAFRADEQAGPTVYELPRRKSTELVKEL